MGTVTVGSEKVFSLFKSDAQPPRKDDVYDHIRHLTVFDPYQHQRDGVNKAVSLLKHDGFAAVFADMGTGKTLMTIATFTALHVAKQADVLLVICPKPLMGVWMDEIPKHSLLPFSIYRWKSGASKADDRAFCDFRAHDGPRAAIFNIEAFQVPNRKLIERMRDIRNMGRVLMVVDESSYCKDVKAKRTKNIISLGARADYRMILTGTEVVNSPLDLYSQFEFLKTGFWGVRSYFQFRMNYAILQDAYGAGGRTFKKVVGFRDVDKLANQIAPYIFRARKDECLDLPEKVRSVIHVELTEKQKRYYKELQKHLATILESGEVVTVENKVSLFTKFRQISGGTIKSGDEHIVLEDNPEKMEALLADIESHNEQAIIWAAFTHEIELISRALSKVAPTVTFYGEVSQDNREENVRAFQVGSARFFVANPSSAGFGLNLQNAHIQYVYSRHLSPAVNWQAEDRTHRVGQKNVCIYKTIVARGTVDEAIEEMLAAKTDLREAFRSMNNEAILKLCTLKESV